MELLRLLCLIFLAKIRPNTGQIARCPPGQWQCDDGNCVPAVWRCDGQGDCLDGSDEMDCAAAARCPAGQVPCVDSVGCVDASARCDGIKQCPTGSDEENCDAAGVTEACLDSDWTCRNRLCVPKELRCDGVNDCVDNSDETDCGVCSEDGLRCSDGTCLSPDKRCDGRDDCSDGSDEPLACGRSCSVNNGGCSHTCVDKSWGALCACPAGLRLASNGAICKDVDECASSLSPCAHVCTNNVGSYHCLCREGFTPNGVTNCLPTGNETRLLMVQRRTLGLLSVQAPQFQGVQTPVLDAVALAYDISRGWFYWADRYGTIHKSDGQQSWKIYTGEPGIKSVACDWLNGHIFWTNERTAAIYMQAVDGKSVTTVLSKDIGPSDLVLLSVESMMFWINTGPGDRVTIEKSWMDGSDRTSLAVLTAQSAHSLTADVAARRLFWISDFKKSIETVKVDGTGRHSFTGLFSSRTPLSLAAFGNFFFWVDDKGLWQLPQNQPEQKKFLWKAELPLLTVFHELHQPEGSSACDKAPCSLCQLSKRNPLGFICACPNFHVLMLDGTCDYPRFVYATDANVNRLEFRGDSSTDTMLFSTDEGILSFDVDWYRNLIYWANRTGHVQRTRLTQVISELVPTPLPVCLVKVDLRNGNLYWVSSDRKSIGTIATGSHYPMQLYRTAKEIGDFHLDWIRGGILWLEENWVLSMSMTGGKPKQILQISGEIVGSVAFDLRATSLLWNSKKAGLTTLSLLRERSHQAGRRWNISGSVVAAFEPYLLSLSDDVMSLWDRREGNVVQTMPVRAPVSQVVPALGDFKTAPVSSVCSKPSVLCRQSSVCISENQLCDGKQDCPDGQDEEFCVTTCPSKEDFKCKDNSRCISRTMVCDGRSHCPDGSDEAGCSTVAPPPPPRPHPPIRRTPLRCRIGSRPCKDRSECVLMSHVCDGEKDCKDGSDEVECDATPTTPPDVVTSTTSIAPTLPACRNPNRICPSDQSCISPSQFCDGRKDCPDGFDEKNCVKRCPNKSDFRCKDRRSCVSRTLVCDGRSHCHDGSDEVNCPTVAAPAATINVRKCRLGSRPCKDGSECILFSHVCDGERDCPDGSDEDGCDTEDNTTPTEGPVDGSGRLTDPPTESLNKPSCSSPSILCPGSSLCIDPTQICDGKLDCPDGSDERCVKKCPEKTDFLCRDRRSCVSRNLVCDGRSHCYDGSDEVDCPTAAAASSVPKCRYGAALCKDRTECVLMRRVCDGLEDCQDGSDEEGCDSEENSTERSGGPVEPPTEAPTQPPCTSPSVLCPGSSLCLSPAQICDGKRDCPDGSDEQCMIRCPKKSDFLCKDRRSCVARSLVCDGRSHCHDGSDEVSCPTVAPTSARPKALKCPMGSRLCRGGSQCVLLSHICDGDWECPDGSDEEGCGDAAENPDSNKLSSSPEEATTQPPACTSPSYLCPQSSVCIDRSQVCDGRRDCPDGSDERCEKKCSEKTDFLCKDRRSCVSSSLVCDGRPHCYDGSDEVDCPTAAATPVVPKCRYGFTLCKDRTECVRVRRICDGLEDCQDGSDEEGCDVEETPTENPSGRSGEPVGPPTEAPTQPPCTSPSVLCPGSSLCLSPAQICDGKRDCPDGSDEQCVKRCPKKSDFLCKDRRSCVSRSLVCDGRSHCHDGSDEVGCPTVAPPSARPKALKCRMGSRLCSDESQCVLLSHICDGERDCQDGSDEEGCDSAENPNSNELPSSPEEAATQSPTCTSPSFLCPQSSVCIGPSQVCDGQRDCPDGSDERCLTRCSYTEFLCTDRSSCVSKSVLCDGHAHCRDGSDEDDCPDASSPASRPKGLKCRMGSRPCSDGTECVLYNHVCDGEKDCVDGSDEQGCPETCQKGEFQCTHGKMCIPAAQVCDGKPQCRDRSDELNCWQQSKSCEYRCADGNRCIRRKFLCDGEKDCLDGTDEQGCEPSPTATTTEPPVSTSMLPCIAPSVLCPGSSLCISHKQLCDSRQDCPDGFDERDCVFQCSRKGDFLCSDHRKCVSLAQVCDGRSHCPDGSDEKQCRSEDPVTPSSYTQNTRAAPLKCRKGFKPCKDGLDCVMYSHVCDGEDDCRDGSDEEGCAAQCKAGEFQCAHGNRCVPPDQVCDGQYDCQDRSDELNCSKKMEGCHRHCDNNTRCIPDTFLCDGERDCADGSDEEKCGLVACAINQYRCTSGQCVFEGLRCDGYPDCSDHSDEMGCARPPRCPSQLRCPNSHECLQKLWICDGEKDCRDGSDEKNCETPAANCREQQWQCGDSSQCVPVSWRCDGKTDCHNGADEDKCSQRKCPFHLYPCGSGECVDPTLVCNGFTNCADQSDEGEGCFQRNCSSTSAPRCDEQCASTPNGPRCYCAAGFQLHSNGWSCVDVDECNSVSGVLCQQICRNTRGSYVCSCNPGFYLEPDNKSCKAKDEPRLLASVQSELLLLGVHSGNLSLLVSSNRPVFSLDYHWRQQRVYWLSPGYQSIRWTDMKNSNNKGTLIKGVKSDFIAVDWVGKNLYWVDGLVGQILAVKLSDATVKSQDYTVVLGEDLEQPKSLVLLPHRGLMLWSEIGSTPQIGRSGMDGSERKVVVSRGLSWPVSLAYDLLGNRVYWADEKLRCIGSASLDGDNVKILQLAETPSPFSVAVFNDRIFWSDTKRRTIRSADKNTGKDQKVLLKRPSQPFGLKLIHVLSQPAVLSPCDQLRCSHICLLAPAAEGWSRAPTVGGLTAVCRCPNGLLLSKDRITCSLPTESTFILLLSSTAVYQIYLHSMQKEGVGLKKMPNSGKMVLPAVTEASGLDVSVHELSLYVADTKRGVLDVLKLGDPRSRQGLTPVGQVLQLKDDSVTALAVDWVTSNVYWSSTNRPNLHVTSRQGSYTTSLLQGSLKDTTSIALHPPTGRLCYTAIGVSQAEVNCAWMDGRNNAVLWRKSSIPTSLVFCNKGATVYWADRGEGIINSIGVDGSGYKQFKTGSGQLVSFTHIQDLLLWVTADKDVTKLWFSDGLQPKQLWFETKTVAVEVKAYSNTSQTGTNGCSSNNGQCDHLCLPHPGGQTCRCGQSFYAINATSCVPLPDCPDGERSCPDGTKCISSSKFCDGQPDCSDRSDELDCPKTDSSVVKSNADPQPNGGQDPVHPVKTVSVTCDLHHCNNHGTCIAEDDGPHCHCTEGYKGEFCQEKEGGHNHAPAVLGVFCLIALLTSAAFIFFKSRAWENLRRSTEKETLMANMGLANENYESDTEELDSSVDVKNPPLALKSRQNSEEVKCDNLTDCDF